MDQACEELQIQNSENLNIIEEQHEELKILAEDNKRLKEDYCQVQNELYETKKQSSSKINDLSRKIEEM